MNCAYDYEEEDVDMDLCLYEIDTESEQEPSYCCKRSPCGRCMDCLGMSERDFM